MITITSQYSKRTDVKQPVGNEHRTSEIEALQDFNWATTEPLKFRPFKPIYYITMGERISLIYFLYYYIPPKKHGS